MPSPYAVYLTEKPNRGYVHRTPDGRDLAFKHAGAYKSPITGEQSWLLTWTHECADEGCGAVMESVTGLRTKRVNAYCKKHRLTGAGEDRDKAERRAYARAAFGERNAYFREQKRLAQDGIIPTVPVALYDPKLLVDASMTITISFNNGGKCRVRFTPGITMRDISYPDRQPDLFALVEADPDFLFDAYDAFKAGTFRKGALEPMEGTIGRAGEA